MGSNRAAFESLMEAPPRSVRGQVPVRIAPDPIPAARVLLDPDGKPATLRDIVAAIIMAGLASRGGPGQDRPGQWAGAAFGLALEFLEARQQLAAEERATKAPHRGPHPWSKKHRRASSRATA